MPIRPLAGAVLAALALAAASSLVQAAPLDLAFVRGGAVQADAVVQGRRVYVPTGRSIATWNYANPAAPVRVSTSAPGDGAINGLTVLGNHLYAVWRGWDGTGGVITYSLANPDAPALVSNTTWPAGEYKNAAGIVVANGQLYVFDAEYGIFRANLADPGRPTFGPAVLAQPLTAYSRVVASGNRIHASGRSFNGTSILDVYDVSNPAAPVQTASNAIEGFNSFGLVIDGRTVMGVGYQLTTFGMDAQGNITPRAAIDIDAAYGGARTSTRAFTFGIDAGLNIWNVVNSAAPKPAGRINVSTLGARRAIQPNGLLLVPTETDLMQAFNVPKLGAVTHASTSWIPGGTHARDAAIHDGKLVLLQPNYGLTINDPATLAPLARFEADLPQTLQERDFEQMKIVGNTAYLAAWGYGMITVDLTGGVPRELGRTPLVFASVIDVQGRYAYVAKWTNGGLMAVVDVQDPTNPTPIWQIGLGGQPYRLQIANNHAFLAEGADGEDTGGLRIFSLANPAEPVVVGRIDDGCGYAFDVSIDATRKRAYLACATQMQVIDVANPAQPVVIGRYENGGYSDYTTVAHRGTTVWFGDAQGVHEIDAAQPAAPVRTRLTGAGHQGTERLLPTADGRLYALTGGPGVHVFAPAAKSGARARASAKPATARPVAPAAASKPGARSAR